MRMLRLAGAVGLLLLGSCGDEAQNGLDLPSTPARELSANACPGSDQVRAQIRALFPAGALQDEANNRYSQVLAALRRQDVPGAQAQMFSLVEFMLVNYRAGALSGGQSQGTKLAVVTLIDGFFCTVGLPTPNLPPSALDDEGTIVIVNPNGPAQNVVTPSQTAGVGLPANSVPNTTMFAIFRLPDTPAPLNTPLDQYPAFYEFSASPAQTFSQDVLVGACQVATFSAPAYGRLKLGHNLGGTGFELLPKAVPAFLNCSQVSPNGVVADGTCCLGGSTRSFSPFGAVDTLTTMDKAVLGVIHGAPGSSVPAASLPAVRIATPAGNPVPGVTVTFSVPQGSEGTITGAVQVTDANGVARVGSWTLGSGQLPNTVVATGTPLPGSGIDHNGSVFTALVP